MSSPSSLFSASSSEDEEAQDRFIASTDTPPIPGLYILPSILLDDVAHEAIQGIAQTGHLQGGIRDQIMYFAPSPDLETGQTRNWNSSRDHEDQKAIPSSLLDLLNHLAELLKPLLDQNTWDMVFAQQLARQVIVNLYNPGDGISPHVDLPHRYADGIIGVSLMGSATMTFRSMLFSSGSRSASSGAMKAKEKNGWGVYLPPRSIYVLTGESRWEWSHGIEPRSQDRVQKGGKVETVLRDTRLSVTYRWIKEGGNVLAHDTA